MLSRVLSPLSRSVTPLYRTSQRCFSSTSARPFSLEWFGFYETHPKLPPEYPFTSKVVEEFKDIPNSDLTQQPKLGLGESI